MNKYKNCLIYYWSGTGNSYRISTWVEEKTHEHDLPSQLKSIDIYNPAKEIKNNKDNITGIIFPTHGFTAPWHIIKFVWRLPPGKSIHTFCIATRAGLKFGSVFPPGISGSATFIIALILFLKGYHVRGVMSVDMPSNWFSLHPIQSLKNHEAIINRGEKKTSRFIEKTLHGDTGWFTWNNLYEFTWGILLSLISVGYLFVGRFFLAKLFFANTNCDGCGVCAESCSVRAITMWGKKNPKPFWRYNCESCMRCAAFCPKNAIESGQSWGVILYYITAIPVATYLLLWLDSYIPGMRSMDGTFFSELLYYLYLYPAIFLSYKIFHLFIQIPAINWFFTNTTLTHFWGRYREPNTKLRHVSVHKRSLSSKNSN
jgi:ferredoxin